MNDVEIVRNGIGLYREAPVGQPYDETEEGLAEAALERIEAELARLIDLNGKQYDELVARDKELAFMTERYNAAVAKQERFYRGLK